MRAALCIVLLLLWAPSDDFPDTWLEGTIGRNLNVRMFIGAAGWPLTEGLQGIYFYTSQWEPIALEGEALPSGRLRIYEGDPGSAREARARFEMAIGATEATGTWTSADRLTTLPVRLRRVPQPAPFKRAVARPRTFSDPRWPFTLTYPAGWWLNVSETNLLLRSPDPQDMLYENELRCERGQGLPAAPAADATPVLFEGLFFRDHDGWLAPTESGLGRMCDEFPADCARPHERSKDGVRLLSADIGYRAYNAWGYAGQAEASTYLVLDGENWAYCQNRLLDSPRRLTLRRATTPPK